MSNLYKRFNTYQFYFNDIPYFANYVEINQSFLDENKDKENNEENDFQCSICLNEYAIGDKVHITQCKHMFHIDCIRTWLKGTNKTCPICRIELNFNLKIETQQPAEYDDYYSERNQHLRNMLFVQNIGNGLMMF
uniref:RING-type domain-containing protein n=1 Tax=Meloidogyne hapla TaxID=6305 RepID=A0A1I8BZF0_MELHA